MRNWKGGVARFGEAWVSRSDSRGETDIVVLFASDSGSLVLLIENKIGAEFQPRQPERYRERAERWKESGGAGWDVETVLLAPGAYFGNEGSDIFDRQLSYEAVIEVLSNSSDQRTRFLADMLKYGIESHREGYVPVHDEVTTQVWKAFWETAKDETPRLRNLYRASSVLPNRRRPPRSRAWLLQATRMADYRGLLCKRVSTWPKPSK